MPSRCFLTALLACGAFTLPTAQAQTSNAANPASTHCLDKGGTLAFEKDGSGGRFGVCRFEDNRQCEEWALLRGDCPAGGLRITGYVTPAARYCALRGGQYQVLSDGNRATEQGRCGFADGKSCAALAYFNGLCSPGTAGDTVHALLRCDGGRTVDAVFSNGSRNSVALVLSDGRALVLPQATSASGARYANADESFVFWNKGHTAFINEKGKTSYRGCSTQP